MRSLLIVMTLLISQAASALPDKIEMDPRCPEGMSWMQCCTQVLKKPHTVCMEFLSILEVKKPASQKASYQETDSAEIIR